MMFIHILIEENVFNYGKVIFSKQYYYADKSNAIRQKQLLEDEEVVRKNKSKEINKKPYSERTGSEITFGSNNDFYFKRYTIQTEKIID